MTSSKTPASRGAGPPSRRREREASVDSRDTHTAHDHSGDADRGGDATGVHPVAAPAREPPGSPRARPSRTPLPPRHCAPLLLPHLQYTPP
ncbi:unnamed protein product, partial [Brenthis ino]